MMASGTMILAMAENYIVMEDGEFEDEVDLEEEDETLFYFAGLFRREAAKRAIWLKNFARSVKKWASKPNDLAAKKLLAVHLPTALRLSLNAPLKDIRVNMAKILEELQASGYEVPQPLFDGPSSFIPKSECVCYASTNEALSEALTTVQSLYEETFLNEGRLSHIMLLLGYHPSYLSCFVKTHNFLMCGDGPLPLYIRNYIAILAASRHKCSYLVTMQEAEFLKNGGEITWLQGVNFLPSKMLSLLAVNKVLAHQPWYVSTDHMKSLLKGTDSWSVSELVHALVIMAHFHALASFALGCGVNPEIDTPLGHTTSGADNHLIAPLICTNPALGIGVAHSDSDFTDSEPISPVARSPTNPQISQSIVQHFFDSTEDSSGDLIKLADILTETLKTMQNDSSSSDEETIEMKDLQFEESASSTGMECGKGSVPTPVNLVKYLEDPHYEHEDFTHSSAVTLRARDYSWEDHGFPFVNQLYPDIGPLLDEKFQLAFQMTYHNVGTEKGVDTSVFRQAIWYYIHSIKGIRHDDYHYRKVNQVLDIGFKTYIRRVGCFPEQVTKFNYMNTMGGLAYSEKVHVNILVLEARMQAELIYSLRAIMTYMKQLL